MSKPKTSALTNPSNAAPQEGPSPTQEVSPPETVEATPEGASSESPAEVQAEEPAETALVPASTPSPIVAVAEVIPDVMNPDRPFDPHKVGAFEELGRLFPKDARYLKQMSAVRDDELADLVELLPEAQRAAFKDALSRMNPIKIGSHSRRGDGLRIFDIRINHGTGNDETRPKGTPEGGLYSTDSRILATSDRDLALVHKTNERLDVYVIAERRGNTYWPPKDDQPAEGEVRSNAPLCRSVDQEKGDVYGSCAACPNRPFKNGSKPEEDECRTEIVLYVVPVDFSGLYRVPFTGTNTKAGRAIVTKFAAWNALWEHPLSLATKKEVSKTDKDKRWFLIEADVKRAVTPTKAEHGVLLALARKIDTEIYWPERRRIYLAAAKAVPPATAKKANVAGLLAKAQAGAGASAPAATKLPDASRGNNL